MSLDTRLKEWAAAHEAPRAHLDQLAARTVTEAARRRFVSAGTMRLHRPLLPRWGYATIGAAAALLVCAVCSQRIAGPQPEDGAVAAVRRLPALEPDRAPAMKRVFCETARLFPRRLRWMAQSNGDMGLGLETEEQPWLAETPPMLVRLVVVSRAGAETAWQPVWSADVVVRREDLAEVTLNRQSASKVALWVYPLTGGKLAVDTAVELDAPLRLASRLSTVVEAGEPAQVAAVRAGDTDYRLFQTVEPLRAWRECGS